MKMTDLQQKISALLPEMEFRFNEPMSKHTSFKIGGPAEIMAFPQNVQQLRELIKVSALLDIKPRILGAGTNILAPDAGISGLTICLKDCLDGIEQPDSNHIRVAAGVTMTRAAVYAAGAGLSGLEFAHGIPGTVGGGVYMNAGAYGGEMKDCCERIEVVFLDGSVKTLSSEEMAFSYRHSVLEKNGGIVVSVLFSLTPKPEEEIRAAMQELMARRKASQPLDKPSAGSAFKRPVGGYAAALIDEVGLKGYRIGGAEVSAKHAGFIVNSENAKAADVLQLLTSVSQIVFDKTGIRLEPEVRIW